MSNWPTPFFMKCPMCNEYVPLEVKRGAGPTCPGPARTFKGEHYCQKFGWAFLIVGRKSQTSVLYAVPMEIPEGKLFPEPKIFPRREMKLKITGGKNWKK